MISGISTGYAVVISAPPKQRNQGHGEGAGLGCINRDVEGVGSGAGSGGEISMGEKLQTLKRIQEE